MIRAITLGVPSNNASAIDIESVLRTFQTGVQALLLERNWPLRTTRMSLQTLREVQEDDIFALPAKLASISRMAEQQGIRWFCLPIDMVGSPHYSQRLDLAFAALFSHSKMFVNLMVADETQISLQATHHAARFIQNVSRKSNNGFDNFRVGASCACPPNAPFFPFSRHEGETFKFSLALETTDLALKLSKEVMKKKISLEMFADRFIDYLQARLEAIDVFARELATKTGVEYAGLDASLAPFPDGDISIGKLLSNLGARPSGSQGTLFLTSILTNCIKTAVKRSNALATGFNGVMFSVLEDDELASANNRRRLSIDTLNAWSTVCGCGLDMIPIPGSTLVEDISAIILDTSALAVRLKKPLGVRLLPIPGKEVNEFTQFNFDFLCNSRVINIDKTDVHFCEHAANWKYKN